MLLAPPLAMALIPFASPPQAEAPPALERRIVIRAVAPEQPILAGQARVAPRRISLNMDGKLVQLEDQPRPPADEGHEATKQQAFLINIQAMAFCSENFDQLVFRGRDPEARRKALYDALATWIKGVELGRRLDPIERRRLELAGTGDIERFFRRVEAARRQFEANRFDYARGRGVIKGLAPLAGEFELGPFGPGSLFQKTAVKLMVDGLADPLRLARPAGTAAAVGARP